mgnify:CR=1 FL=1
MIKIIVRSELTKKNESANNILLFYFCNLCARKKKSWWAGDQVKVHYLIKRFYGSWLRHSFEKSPNPTGLDGYERERRLVFA